MKLKYFLLSILAIFAPIRSAMITVVILVFSDFFLGIAAAKKRKEAITSDKMRHTISKILIFEMCLILSFLVEVYLIGSFLPVAKLTASFIGLVEFQSIVENLNEINGSPVFLMLLSMINKKQDEINPNKSETPK